MYTQYILECIRQGKRYKIYHLGVWKAKRKKILELYHNECFDCRLEGKLTLDSENNPLEVHHNKDIANYPELFLENFYKDNDGTLKPNLIPLCHRHHDIREGRFSKKVGGFMNEEKW